MQKSFLFTMVMVLTIGLVYAWALNTSNSISIKYIPDPLEKYINNDKSDKPDPNIILQGGETCADATVISTLPFSDFGTTVIFADNYDVACPYPATAPDVVYVYSPVAAEQIDISLCNSGTNYNTKLFVFDGCEPILDTVACNEDFCGVASEIRNLNVLAGHDYYIVVDGYESESGNFHITVDLSQTPPPYDNCTDIDYDSTLAIGSSRLYEGDNTGATLDPNCDSLTIQVSWIQFRTTEITDIKLEFCGTVPVRTGYYRILADGCPCNPQAFFFAANENDTDCGDGNMTFYFVRVPAGEWYYPVIGGPFEGPYTITVSASFATGECEYSCTPGATPESEPCGDDTNGGCNSDPPIWGSVYCGEHICGELLADGGIRDTDWYKYTPSQDTIIMWGAAGMIPLAVIVIDVTAGCADTEMVYLGGQGRPECDTAYVIAHVQAGHEIACFVSTDGIFSGYTCGDGPFIYEAWLECISAPPPSNDDCVNAIAIGDVADYAWSNVGAKTDNTGDCGENLGSEIWYEYTASCNGMVTVDLCDSDFDTYLGIFDNCIDMNCIAFDDDGCGITSGPSIVSFAAVESSTYLIALGGWAGSMGLNGLMDIYCSTQPTITVNPESMSDVIPKFETVTEFLTVSNDGEQDLIFEAYPKQEFPGGQPLSARQNIKTPITTPVAIPETKLGIERMLNPPEHIFANVKRDVSNNDLIKGIGSNQANLAGDKYEPPLIALYCEILQTGNQHYVGNDWFTGQEMYAVYQDPEICGFSPTYPFVVTSMRFALRRDTITAPDEWLYYQCYIYNADLTNPSCPVPGTDVLYAGDLDSVEFAPGDFLWITEAVFVVVYEPYFIVVDFPVPQTNFQLPLEGSLTGYCLSYNDWGNGWEDFAASAWDLNLSNLWRSDGTTPVICNVECPPGATREDEVCGNDLNGGCNSDPYAVDTIRYGDVICGTCWADSGFRDTDWYEFTLTDSAYIQVALETEFPTICYLLEVVSCDTILLYGSMIPPLCEVSTIFGTLSPGTYTIFVAPYGGGKISCSGASLYGPHYVLSLRRMEPWLHIDTYGGAAPPDVDIMVIKSASYLDIGIYHGSIEIESNDPVTPIVSVPVTVEIIPAIDCFQYLPGDANMRRDPSWPPRVIGADVTILINYFLWTGNPEDSPCPLDGTGFWMSADANGDCELMGRDATYLINYTSYGGGPPLYCPDYEPCWPTPGNLPPDPPEGWPNCDIPMFDEGTKIIATKAGE